jgi:molecular chaperone GrpE
MMHKNRNKPDDQGPPPPGASHPKGEGRDGAGRGDGGEADAALEQTAALVQSLTAEREDALEKWKRALADFQNYQRRALENEREARRQGATSVLQSIIPVLDHFDMAISHETTDPGAAQVMEGVKAIRDELIKALAAHNVVLINPEINSELDPTRHQVITEQPAPQVEPGHVSMVLQVGYALGDRVIRPAKVAVAPARAGRE